MKKNTGKSRVKKLYAERRKPPVETQFSSVNQPDFQKRKEIIQQRNFNRSVLRQMLNLKFQFEQGSKIEKELAQIFGSEIKNATVGILMIARQIQKAVIDADTHAFNILMNQGYGLPKMEVDVSTPQKLIVEIKHDDTEIKRGLKSDLHPVS